MWHIARKMRVDDLDVGKLIGFSKWHVKIIVEHLETEVTYVELLTNSAVQPVFKEFHISRSATVRD
jgi:subtilisin-like proprotein convertase family protein